VKKLYENQKHSIYELQKMLGLDCKRLYRYADKSIDIKKMPINIILGISNIEKLEPNVLFEEMKRYLR
jgi:hypothetical protein